MENFTPSRWAEDRQKARDKKLVKVLGIVLVVAFIVGTAYSYSQWGIVQL